MNLAERTREICNRANREINKKKRLEATKEAELQKRISTLTGFANEVADLLFEEANNGKSKVSLSLIYFDRLQHEIEYYAETHPESKSFSTTIIVKIDSSASDPHRYMCPQICERYKYKNENKTKKAVKQALAVKFSKLVSWCRKSGYTIEFINSYYRESFDVLSVCIVIGW